MKLTDEYKVCSLEKAEKFAERRKMNKPNYVAEAPYQPGYEDAVVTEPRPFLSGIYKSKPLTDEEITGIRMQTEGDALAFARAIERRHGIK
jgi:hypothetical protein